MYCTAVDLYKDCRLKFLHSAFKFWAHVSAKVRGIFFFFLTIPAFLVYPYSVKKYLLLCCTCKPLVQTKPAAVQ